MSEVVRSAGLTGHTPRAAEPAERGPVLWLRLYYLRCRCAWEPNLSKQKSALD
jgi:hypothetical protein